ncbi:MAG TPA: putative molybdenum carrier protein, partial [Ignavibacteriaceae bacterium]
GEKLTKRKAGDKLIAVSPWETPFKSAERIVDFLQRKGARTLNIAGNGIYTWAKFKWDQDKLNIYMALMLQEVHRKHPIESIRSGGQTGADWAGLVAAEHLNIPGVGYFPKGFLQRGVNNIDFTQNKQELTKKMAEDVGKLVSYFNISSPLPTIVENHHGNSPGT